MLYDEGDEVAFAAPPKPGRLVVFDGAIKRVEQPLNRICYASFAIKFERMMRG